MNRWDRDPFNLTGAFATERFYAPADDTEGEAEALDETKSADAPEPDPPPPAAQDEDEQGDEDEIRNPRMKELSDEAAKWRRKFREVQDKLKDHEDGASVETLQSENRELHLRLAWERATADANLRDADAAWKLASDELATVDVTDGTVDTAKLGELVNRLLQRYPYLVAPEDEPQGDEETSASASSPWPDAQPSGRRTAGKTNHNSNGATLAALQKKFPALRAR